MDEVVRRGVADRHRIAIGGHSYGAFMTANLLAHTRLFRAGIARSGAYNRSLTPFGFQAEERNYWQALDTYAAMSPFNHADRIRDPLLIIHGEQDNNSGTYPIQSERLYAAIKGLGGHARLVMLPNESHGYRARESIMHMLAETNDWLEKYVRDAKPEAWPFAVAPANENARPIDRCVVNADASTSVVSTRIVEPVVFRYSESPDAVICPMYPPARNVRPSVTTLPNARLSRELTHPKRRPTPTSFVYCASTVRHQK